MAEKLHEFDFTKASVLTNSEKATYPWDEWLDGDIWQLVQDVDFYTHPLMMERIIRTRATSRGAKVRIKHLPLDDDAATNGSKRRKQPLPFGKLILQRTDIEGPSAQEAIKAAAKQKREANKAKREALAKEAEETLAKAGIPTVKSKGKATGKATAAKPSKTPTKRPARQLVGV